MKHTPNKKPKKEVTTSKKTAKPPCQHYWIETGFANEWCCIRCGKYRE